MRLVAPSLLYNAEGLTQSLSIIRQYNTLEAALNNDSQGSSNIKHSFTKNESVPFYISAHRVHSSTKCAVSLMIHY